MHTHTPKIICKKPTIEELYQNVYDGNLRVVENILKNRINPNIVMNGYPLLIVPIFKYNLPLVKLLLEYNADPNIKTSLNLHYGFFLGINIKNITSQYTPLHIAIFFGRYDIMLTLIKYGAILDLSYKDNLGNSLLHMAVSCQSLKIVDYLLQQGFNPNCLNHENKSPLTLALDIKNQEIIILLEQYSKYYFSLKNFQSTMKGTVHYYFNHSNSNNHKNKNYNYVSNDTNLDSYSENYYCKRILALVNNLA